MPGTLRDSRVLLGVVLEQQPELQPTQIMTDTGAYSELVFGLFRLCGDRFCPRLPASGRGGGHALLVCGCRPRRR